ncbi:tryptophan halogenase family protein [Sphingomonas sp. Leaf25]|uniref:tryptophan halogenase family protein n=1 Tax=Sphingomonas sp. Leaf25 TaxID=1735692 RepID=UPI0006F26CFD|nr:tryptophan halogenase family protein [Sphingomonas sp. Leaf25]KQM98893.1 tryptophan halogenase [Sphingomonas sp. Leaf25]
MGAERRIAIVGGGTAGWLTAAYLARALGSSVRITLLESPGIGIIGVGEGTFPTIRETLRFLGIDEAQFVTAAGATFKQGVRFDGWRRGGPVPHRYYHPFEPPFPADRLVAHWLRADPATRPPFAQAVTIQHPVAAANRAPKQPGDEDFDGPLAYAYHFDAVRLAGVLADRARASGVAHVEGRIAQVVQNDDGTIERIDTDAGPLHADLFVDCTGFRAELIGQLPGAAFRSVADQLFTDRALTCKLPCADPDAPIESTTIATAHEAGWIWDIGLSGARGIGCVYASRYIDDDRAADLLRAYLGPAADGVTPRRLTFDAGWRPRQWVGNCVAVGLSAGFLEPLESTGVVLIEAAAAMIAELLPHAGPVDAPAGRFNAVMAARFAGIVDFLKLHYCLSDRTEPFWRDNADPASWSPRLTDLLDQWRHRPPSRFDFPVDTETFAFFNYQYILYGMGFATVPPPGGAAQHAEAQRLFARIRSYGDHAVRDLPPHRVLVDGLRGLPAIPARTGS